MNQNLSSAWRVNLSFIWQIKIRIVPDSVKKTGPALANVSSSDCFSVRSLIENSFSPTSSMNTTHI